MIPAHIDTEGWGRCLAQQYANRLPAHLSGYYRPMRDMTAADLGLPRHHEVWTSQPMMDFAQAQRDLCRRDAPYSFWLGADGRNSKPDDFKASC